MIDVLVPVLGRPQNVKSLSESFHRNTPHGPNLIFLCTPGDEDQITTAVFETDDWVVVMDWTAGPGDYARKINCGFNFTDNPYVLNASDDIEFTAGWAEAALRNMTGHISVVATNDRANASVKRGRFGTHCLIRRSYIDERGGTFDNIPGVVMWEGYDHNYVDRELCAVAQARGVYAYAADSVITHRHPLWKTAEWDDTYRKGHARIREDHALFVERQRAWKQPTTVI